MTLEEIIEKAKTEPLTVWLINDLLSHVLTPRGVERWWLRPIPSFGGKTPWETWHNHDPNLVLETVLSYLDPSFS